ncbi:MAG: hypoxanthine phosphoribosyltransferase [Bacteroidaceae bacterium]|nr:hypoxanthine phosphoribosyltransferase [Bacteroidaceae bacterium]MBR4783411.1 hypoxanthine phosphoribosyltransferase [Bacteroidaceae bacterium]
MNDPEIINLNNSTFRRLISAKEIEEKIALLAQQIRKDMGNAEVPVFLCILKGAFVFAADLVRNYDGLCELQFLRLSSYSGTDSTGEVKAYPGLDTDKLKGRRVVIVEDIVDTGLSMNYLLKDLRKYKPRTLDVAALFTKPSRLCHDVKVDYSCFEIPDAFIVGYGLDYDGLYRNLPAIYVKE